MIIELPGAKPSIEQACFVAPNATISGQVVLGKDVSVWFNAVIRAEGDSITIGDETNVQDHVMVHVEAGMPVSIGKRVTIGHSAVVHGCTVEDDALIGMNATILDKAVIGRGSLVAAGALVPEGMIVPPYSLVAGVPAKVKKTFSEEDVAKRCDHYVPHYIEEGKEYARILEG